MSLTNGAILVGIYNNANGGTLAGVTLDGTLDLATNNGANVTITGGLTLNGTIDLGNTSVSTYGRLNFVGAQTLGGTGSVVFGGPTGYIHNNQITTASNNGDSGTLTIGAGITIEGQYGSIGNSALPLINQGTIDANVSGGGISINGTNWSNSGTFQAANDGSLTLNGTWSSSGSITVSGGTIDVSGDWTDTGPISVDTGAVYLEGTSNLATDAGFSLGGSGGTVYFEGMLNDAGATLAANDLTCVLDAGTIDGGTLSLTNGAILVGIYNNANGGTLAGVTLDGTLDLATNNGANVTITGGLTLNGTIDLGNTSVSTYGRLNFVGAQTLGGTGSVVFGGPTGYIHNNQITTASNNGDSGTLTIGAGITIEGQYGSIGNSALPLINQGTIDANVSGGGISINGTNWSNSGTFQAANDGSLTLNGTWSSSGSITVSGGTIDVSGDWTDTGPISVDTGAVYLEGTSNLATDAGFSLGGSGGTVYFEGMLNDAGATLAANDLTCVLDAGTIDGGTLSLTNGAILVGIYNNANGGTLADVTLDGTLDLATNNGANVTITGGLTLNGTIDLGNTSVSTYGRLNFVGAQTLGGTGSVVFGGPTGYIYNNQITTASNNGDSGTLTIGAGITIEGQYGSIGNSALPLINQGTIDANVSGGEIGINGTNWTNSGTLQASNGGELALNVSELDNRGTVAVQSGSLHIDSPVAQFFGNTLTGGSWEVYGGATLDFGGNETLTTNEATVVLSGAGSTFAELKDLSSNSGTLSISDGATLTTAGDLANTGSVTVGAGSTLTIPGNYSQSAAASLDVEVGGPPASQAFSHIDISGAATLAGTLHVGITNGYIPSAGDRFEVSTFNGESHGFDSTTGLSAGRTQLLAAVLNPTDLVISSSINAADLAMGSISAPSSGTSGDDIMISYTVTNDATEPTFSTSWVDSIYLTQRSSIDPTAKLIGRVEHSGALAGLGSYTATLTAPLPGVAPGMYNVIVLADSEGFVPDVNRANNVGISSTQITVSVQTLTPGVAFSGTIANGQDEFFGVDLPAGSVPMFTAGFSAAGAGSVRAIPERA